ncbi:anti-anti-sigma factor [Krasilnikovia cinnamomea]|uniref:Anti-anti-sigma factor n=1 Tax=Krasilnikovia cinnamomea TaxID=349313 RepID=A0A4Q7ZS42_9ACTN|nr:STAS domain-containing protein [Krasilnikovia cinnamomea]RZU53664.1 anti-anti-sigma factor [Krasilnikovia cinnamomea]
MTEQCSWETHHEDPGGAIRIVVRGDVDASVDEALAAVIVATVEQCQVAVLVIDLAQVSFLGAAGIRALLRGRDAAAERGYRYRVVGAHGIAQYVLRVSGVAELLASLAGD